MTENIDVLRGTEGHTISFDCMSRHDSLGAPELLKLWAADRTASSSSAT